MTKLPYGAHLSDDGASIAFAVRAPAATRVEVWLYAAPADAAPVHTQSLDGSPEGTWRTTVALAAGAPAYYGYRAFGPNWPHDPAWMPGTEHGFVADVDAQGNRFNPNKLLLDPYAREISHCVQTPAHPVRDGYRSGPASRAIDTGPFAPKAVVFAETGGRTGAKPTHPLKDDIVYEVQLRGLTKADPSVPEALRGTYAGAALRAPYLRDLGVTAVEFLPLHQTQNALNDDVTRKDAHNYWGYQTMGFFAPDRRHASDPSPGGATREFKAMVTAFHDAGLKVFLDVVYNHTEEGGGNGDTAQARTIYGFRGLDNARYYETERGEGHPDTFEDETGVGPNFNAAEPIVRDLVIDSLAYWANEMGVDGFRFDLAAVLGNADRDGGFRFDRDDPDNVLNRAVRELPVRPVDGGAGVDLVAEPYAVSMDAQEQGNFPRGWAEWNDRFRDTVRASQNKLGFVAAAPARLMTRIAGSQDMFGGRAPWASVNYVVVHDGFTLADLHGFDEKQNGLDWPYGPSDGGRSSGDEMGWDHGGDVAAQHQAVRTSLALLVLSAGVPLLTGGSEFHRTQRGNNNAYNLDTVASWLDWSLAQTNAGQLAFTRKLLRFRRDHPALRPAAFFTGTPRAGSTIKDLTWYRDDGAEMDAAYIENAGNHFVAWQIDGATAGDPAARLYVAYNGWTAPIRATLPPLPEGERWRLAVDTAAGASAYDNAHEPGTEPLVEDGLMVDGRSCVVAIVRTV